MFLRGSGNNNCMKILLSQIMYERNLSVQQLSILSVVPKSTIYEDMGEHANPNRDTDARTAHVRAELPHHRPV